MLILQLGRAGGHTRGPLLIEETPQPRCLITCFHHPLPSPHPFVAHARELGGRLRRGRWAARQDGWPDDGWARWPDGGAAAMAGCEDGCDGPMDGRLRWPAAMAGCDGRMAGRLRWPDGWPAAMAGWLDGCDGRMGGRLRWPDGRTAAMTGWADGCDGRMGGLLRWPTAMTGRAAAMAGWMDGGDGRMRTDGRDGRMASCDRWMASCRRIARDGRWTAGRIEGGSKEGGARRP